MKLPILIIAVALTSSIFVHSANGLEPDSHFSDHMVLQRDMNVPVWGTAAPNSDVSVSFAGQEVTAKADGEGQWRAVLKPLKVSSEGRVMTISGDGKELKIQNALIGDVWVGSGQSNMAGGVKSYAKNDPTLAELVIKAPYPSIRLMNGGPKPTWQGKSHGGESRCRWLLPGSLRAEVSLADCSIVIFAPVSATEFAGSFGIRENPAQVS